jgi:hypothetical protein
MCIVKYIVDFITMAYRANAGCHIRIAGKKNDSEQ